MFEIGNSLREARVRQQLELSEVELATKIRARYLRALEEETFDTLPAQTYVKGFLRTYADYLGLDGQLYVDEFNSRFGADGDEPREPVVPRRTSNVHRQHRRLERRWIAFALTGIAALVIFFIAAWKSGSPNEQVPNLTTTTTQSKKVLPNATAPARHTATKPVSFRLYVRAAGGNCWMEVRNWSASGKTRFAGTVEPGQSQRFVARQLWVNFGNPRNLAIAFNGDVVHVPRPGSYVFTTHGFTRAAA
jgi:Helix-turn-helix domain/RodZ C-terminal domain